MRFIAQIREYDMDQVILDLEFDANLLPKGTWELLGRPKLQWSLIKLRMAKQQNIIPMGRLPSIIVEIKGIWTIADFKVIEIADDSNPYPTLLGLDFDFDNLAIMNLKKRQMVFEKDDMRIIFPLGPLEGVRYPEAIQDEHCDTDVENID